MSRMRFFLPDYFVCVLYETHVWTCYFIKLHQEKENSTESETTEYDINIMSLIVINIKLTF